MLKTILHKITLSSLAFCVSVLGACQKADTTRPQVQADTVKNRDKGWKEVAPLPDTRVYAGSFSLDGKGYVFGGVSNSSIPTAPGYDDMYMYDPALNKWIKKAGLPALSTYQIRKGRLQPFAFEINGKIFAGGGLSLNGELSRELYQYDALTDTWKLKATTGIDLGLCVGTAVNNKGYIVNDVEGQKLLFVYDLLTNTLKRIESAPYFGQRVFICSGLNQVLYGRAGSFIYGSKFDNSELKTYESLNVFDGPDYYDLPVSEGAIFFKNSIYLAYGDIGHLYRFSFLTRKWKKLTNENLFISQAVSYFLIDSKLYVAGGNNGYFSDPSEKVWAIDLDAYPENE